MYIIKNAMKNISRSLGRNILIGIIAFIIAISSCVALSIKQAAKTAEEEALSKISITASIGVDRQALQTQAGNDREKMQELMSSVSELSLTDMQKYATSIDVNSFNYTLQSSVSGSDSLEPYTTKDETTTETDTNAPPKDDKNIGFAGMGQQGDFTVVGYNNEAGMTDFINGTSKISDGTIFNFTNDNTCIISDTLAAFNNLKTGDTISVTNPNLDTETYTLKITGIYTTKNTSDDTGMRFSTAQDPANYIYTSYNTINTIVAASTSNATVSTDDNDNETTTALRSSVNGVYSFTTVEKYNDFKDSLAGMGLSDSYTVTSSDLANYQNSITPIKNLSDFANIFLLLVLGIGGVILVVLNIFNIRERKYEVGVLTAIGMKKGKVALQFMSELFMVTFIAIILGTAVGAVLSVPVANHLLNNQITATEQTQSQQNQNFGRPGMPGSLASNISSLQSKDYIENIKASTDIYVVGELVGIGILLTVISSIGAVIFIVRFEPLKILSNRN